MCESISIVLVIPKGRLLPPLMLNSTGAAAAAGVAQFVDSNKRAMSLASAVLLITVPWMQISRVAASGVSVSPAALAAVVAAVRSRSWLPWRSATPALSRCQGSCSDT